MGSDPTGTKTTNVLTGRYYIGMHSTNNLDDGYLGSGTRLRYSIRKYGKQNHKVEILEFVNSREELSKRETEIVNLNEIAKEKCLNLIVGGERDQTWKETRIKASKYMITKWQDETYRGYMSSKISEARRKEYKSGKRKFNKSCNFKGKFHTDEAKQKISNSMRDKGIGINNSQFGTMWITNESENKKIQKLDQIPKGWRKGRILK